jgi:flavodoxin
MFDGAVNRWGIGEMKGIVAYDSVHGNTKLVAEAIADEIRLNDHEVELISVGDGCEASVRGEFLFVGSPTRAGHMTRDTKAFIENLNLEYWKDRQIIPFDTVGPFSKDPEKRAEWMKRIDEGSNNAGSRIRKMCQEIGMTTCERPFHVAVIGFTGPLAPDALEMTRNHTRDLLTRMN